jgi:membrane protease YdiL (CAAX protease family)
MQNRENAPVVVRQGFVHRRSLLTFFILAFAFSQAPSLLSPHSLFPLGPIMAALAVLPLAGGRAALAGFWRACTRWRVGLPWYTIAIVLPTTIAATALGLASLLGATIDHSALPPRRDLMPVALTYFVMVGIGEEFAWRGFALPRLMTGRSLLSAALILGLVHVVWHWPLVGGEMTYNQVGPIAISIVAFSVFTAWMYARTGGSLLLPALGHMSVNTTAYYVFDLAAGSDETLLYWLWAAGWAVAGVTVAYAVRERRPSVMPAAVPAIA